MSMFDPQKAGLIYDGGVDIRDYGEQGSWTNPNNKVYKTPDGLLEVWINEDSGRVSIRRTDAAEGLSDIVFDDALEQPYPSHEEVMRVLEEQGYTCDDNQ